MYKLLFHPLQEKMSQCVRNLKFFRLRVDGEDYAFIGVYVDADPTRYSATPALTSQRAKLDGNCFLKSGSGTNSFTMSEGNKSHTHTRTPDWVPCDKKGDTHLKSRKLGLDLEKQEISPVFSWSAPGLPPCSKEKMSFPTEDHHH